MSQYLDGRVTAEEAAALAEILSADPEAAARFAELTRMDEGLRTALKAESRSALFASRLKTGAESAAAAEAAKRPADRRRWLAAAAGLAVLGGTAWWFSQDDRLPAVVMDWAKSRVRRSAGGGEGSPTEVARTGAAERPADRAAELRRKLRGFAIPALQMRSMAVSDAVNTLSRQWTDLPHKNPADAREVKIGFAGEVRKLWPEREDEPVVTVDIPNISLHTALNLVAAQAGLRMEVSADSVSLEPEPPAEQGKGKEEVKDRTWTFPLAKTTVDTFLASIAPARSDALLSMKEWKSREEDLAMRAGQEAGAMPEVKERLTARSLTWTAADGGSGAAGSAGEGRGVLPVLGESVPSVSFTEAPTAQYGFSYTVPGTEAGGQPPPVTLELGMAAPQDGEQLVSGAMDPAGGDAGMGTGEKGGTGAGGETVMDAGARVEITSRFVEADQSSLPASNDGGGQRAGVRVLREILDGAGTGQALTDSASAASAAAGGQKAVRVRVTTLQPEQRNLDQLSYMWLQVPERSGQADAPSGVAGTEPWSFRTVAGTVITPVDAPQVPATLPAWLATFGVSAEGVSHDSENGVLSVTGNPAALRVASAAVAALTESAQSGFSAEMRVVDLGDLPKPETADGHGLTARDPAEVDRLCRKAAAHPGSACVRLPVVPGPPGKAVDFQIVTGSVATTVWTGGQNSGSDLNVSSETAAAAGMMLQASVTAEKQGERWTVNLGLKDGNSGSELNSRHSLMEGAWWMGEGAAKGRLYLLRLRSAAVTQ